MAMSIDGGGWEETTYKTDIKIKYKGLYSKYIDEIYFRGVHNVIEEWGMSIRSDYIKYSKYSFYRSLDKDYSIEHIDMINIDALLREELIRKEDSFVSEDDIILHERDMKLMKIKRQLIKEKSIPFKVRKFFKRK